MRPSDMGTWEAPVGPIPELLPPGTKLIHLPESFVSHEVALGSSFGMRGFIRLHRRLSSWRMNLSSSFHEKLYNRGSASTTLLALGAPPRH